MSTHFISGTLLTMLLRACRCRFVACVFPSFPINNSIHYCVLVYYWEQYSYIIEHLSGYNNKKTSQQIYASIQYLTINRNNALSSK